MALTVLPQATGEARANVSLKNRDRLQAGGSIRAVIQDGPETIFSRRLKSQQQGKSVSYFVFSYSSLKISCCHTENKLNRAKIQTSKETRHMASIPTVSY